MTFRSRRLLSGILAVAGILALNAVCLSAREKPMEGAVTYTVRPQPDASPRRVEITMRFPVAAHQKRVRVQMPTWSPGDYHVQNHARYVRDLRAADGAGGQSLTVTHPDSNTWEIAPAGASAITVAYSLPQTPPGFFSENVQIQRDRAFLNGPAAFLFIAGRKNLPATLRIELPRGWKAEVPLEPILTMQSEGNAAAYAAPDYDTLADSPVVMAEAAGLITREFTVEEKPVKLVFFGRAKEVADPDSYVPVFRSIVQAGARLMGGLPFPRYSFLLDMGGRGGGLEHLNSARMALSPRAQPKGIAGFAAHEFFHLWNVKRIRPRVLGPFDYVKPPRTRNLWFAEGVTEYYGQLLCLRAGLTTSEEFLAGWRGSIRAMQNTPARLKVTADESSWKVWEANNSGGFGGLNYYHKGELIGLCLDLKIRHVTQGRRSLDDVMRLLMQRHAPPKPGYRENGIRDAVNAVAGQNLSAFYDRLARSTQEMPFAECLGYAGLNPEMQPLPDATPQQTALREDWLAAWSLLPASAKAR